MRCVILCINRLLIDWLNCWCTCMYTFVDRYKMHKPQCDCIRCTENSGKSCWKLGLKRNLLAQITLAIIVVVISPRPLENDICSHDVCQSALIQTVDTDVFSCEYQSDSQTLLSFLSCILSSICRTVIPLQARLKRCISNKSAFSLLRRPLMWHCPHLLLHGYCWLTAMQQPISISWPPGPQQQTHRSSVQMLRQMPDNYIDPAPHDMWTQCQ